MLLLSDRGRARRARRAALRAPPAGRASWWTRSTATWRCSRLVFLVLHILTSVLDSFAPIGLIDAVVPFVGAYRPFWLGWARSLSTCARPVILTEPAAGADGLCRLAGDPLADIRKLADRPAARLRHRQRRQHAWLQLLSARLLWRWCWLRCSRAWSAAGRRTPGPRGRPRRRPASSRCSWCCGSRVGRWAQNGRGARARPLAVASLPPPTRREQAMSEDALPRSPMRLSGEPGSRSSQCCRDCSRACVPAGRADARRAPTVHGPLPSLRWRTPAS